MASPADTAKASTENDPYEALARPFVPSVQAPTDQIVGIFCSDIHMSERVPLARSAEPDWIEAQCRCIQQVKALMVKYGCPLFIAGDLLHVWNASPRVITLFLWAIGKGGNVYAVPGQHDIPNHNMNLLGKSAYWTLVTSGAIHHLPPAKTFAVGQLLVTGFPWGVNVTPPTKQNSLCLQVALIHSYIWTEKTGYAGADQAKRYGKWAGKLTGYDLAVFGDNHKPFLIQEPATSVTNSGKRKCSVFNCGALQNRRSDERAQRPRVGLLQSDGLIVQHYLDTSKDKWSDAQPEVTALERATGLDLDGFIEDMAMLRDQGYDWKVIVADYCRANNINKNVQDIITRCLNKKDVSY